MLLKKSCNLFFVILGLFVLLCTGCQTTPEQEVVISKKDGAFDASVIESAEETHAADDTQEVSFLSEFSSTDGSVNFHIGIENTLPNPDMSVVRVVPHFFTATDAKRVANLLFPNAVFYEAEPAREENYSQNEIQEKIERWSQFTSVEALKTLYGDIYTDESLSKTADIVKTFIQQYTLMYESAPSENPHALCRWEMRKTSEYLLPSEELIGKDISNDNDEISIQFTVDGIPYYFTVATRNRSDFRVNMISVYIDDGLSPSNIDERIFAAQLCRTEKPTEEQIDAVAKNAEEILSMMELGEWIVDECYINHTTVGDENEYTICVNAVPVINGLPALRQPQLTSLRDENGYAPNQYVTDANFEFAPSGELISFTLYTPLDTQEIVNDNVKVMSMDTLMKRAQDLLELTDYYEYGFGFLVDFMDEKVKCNVNITQIEYGLARVKVPNSDGEYYYVPAITLKGYAEYLGEETNKVLYQDEAAVTLMTLNAIDGTVINTTNS